MEHIINKLDSVSTVTVPSEISVQLNDFEEYISEAKHSLMFRIPDGCRGKIIHIDASFDGDYDDLVFNACSFRNPINQLTKAGQAFYSVCVDDENIEVPISEFGAVYFPYREVKKFDIKILTDNSDQLIISNFRAVKELMPQDILEAVKFSVPQIPVGNIIVKAGDHHITISNKELISEDSILYFNSEKHQIKQIDEEFVTLHSTFDGDVVLQDYTGVIYIDAPIRIGYVDQDKAPIVLWFQSPLPVLRSTKQYYQVFGEEVYSKMLSQLEKWTITIDIAGGYPEYTQHIASYVRQFLETNRLWVNGERFTFEWTDQAVDNETLDESDSVIYNLNMELREGQIWQTTAQGNARLRNVKPWLI